MTTAQLAAETAAGDFLLWCLVYAWAAIVVTGFAAFCLRGLVNRLFERETKRSPTLLPVDWPAADRQWERP